MIKKRQPPDGAGLETAAGMRAAAQWHQRKVPWKSDNHDIGDDQASWGTLRNGVAGLRGGRGGRRSAGGRVDQDPSGPGHTHRLPRGRAAVFLQGRSWGATTLIVDLCKAVARNLAKQLALSPLRVAYVPVTALDRFDVIQQRKADLLCEATSVTLSRREMVDFSIATFVDGRRQSPDPARRSPRSASAGLGEKIGVLAGTTTEQALRNTLESAGLTAETIPAKTHAEGLAMLDDAKISAYFADRSILVTLIRNSKDPTRSDLWPTCI